MQTLTRNEIVDTMEKELKALSFLQTADPFNVEEVRDIVRIVFKNKTSGSLSQFNAYRMKCMMEWIADFFNEQPRAAIKQCGQMVVKLALLAEGFTDCGDGESSNFNVSARDYLRIHSLINTSKRVYSSLVPLTSRFSDTSKKTTI